MTIGLYLKGIKVCGIINCGIKVCGINLCDFTPKPQSLIPQNFAKSNKSQRLIPQSFLFFSIANFNSAKYFYLLKCLNNVSKIKVEGVVPPVQLRNYEKFVEII